LPRSASAAFSCALAADLAADAVRRFLRYVRIDTQACFDSDAYPSTAKQLELSRLLVDELREIGLADIELTEHGLVFATLPGDPQAPIVGLIAHVDTSPDASGTAVQPIVHVAWDGTPIVLPGDSSQVLDPEQSDELAARVGHDLITSDGTTLLGADDKAGVAAIMAAVAYLARAAGPPHATVRVAFTVDEEVGLGTKHFNVERFGANVAYTLDAPGVGELQVETFSGDQILIRIHGQSFHTGTAKGKLVNAARLAADLVSGLPRDRLSPETTEDREGFIHLMSIHGNVEETVLTFIARDHDDARLAEHGALLRRLAEGIAAREPRARVVVEVSPTYRNMRPALDAHPQVIEAAEEAFRRVGIEPRRTLLRGGTDGALLTAKGLPTPNLFAGGQEYHSVREWLSVQDMAAAAAMVVELARVWSGSSAVRT
jgi:tripeptide aminopeptidase